MNILKEHLEFKIDPDKFNKLTLSLWIRSKMLCFLGERRKVIFFEK